LGRRKRGWKAASGLSLGNLRRLVEAKESLIAKLARLRAKLAAKLATAEADLAAAGGGIVSTVGDVVAAVKRGPGRPKGKRGPGRPKGSKNKPKAGGKRGPGRPKGSRNKPKAKVGGKRGPGRPPKALAASLSSRTPKKRGPGRPGRFKTKTKVATKVKHGRPTTAAATTASKATPAPSAPRKDYGPLDTAIRAAMTGATAPMKAGDIAKKVVEGGYATTNKAFHLEVGRRLAEMDDVAKPEPGLYALKLAQVATAV
jgi:hypothetical protein